MTRKLEARITYDIADHPGTEDWQVNQEVLVQLKDAASGLTHPLIVGDPQFNKVIPAKTKAEG